MKKSDANLAVIQNFILEITHSGDHALDSNYLIPITFTPAQLYKMAIDYINEDHVDGKESPEDEILSSKAIVIVDGGSVIEVVHNIPELELEIIDFDTHTSDDDVQLSKIRYSGLNMEAYRYPGEAGTYNPDFVEEILADLGV